MIHTDYPQTRGYEMKPETPRAQSAQGTKLSSWKEIAEWLGVNVRTAQKWETESGMPVRRVPGSNRVIAYTGELTAWLHGAHEAEAEAARQRGESLRRSVRWAVAAPAAALLLAAAVWILRPASGLADWRVEGSALIALDARGRELWRIQLGRGLHPERYSRDDSTPAAWIEDIDGDGRKELLFCHHQDGASYGDLICFSETGEPKWRWTPGGSAASFREDLRPPYVADRVHVFRHIGQIRILVASIHHTWFPSQLAMLDGQGRLLREYWHSGHIKEFRAVEWPEYPEPLIVAAGIANGYKAADLVVLSPSEFGGASREESPEHQIPGGPPRELARLLFPLSCVTRASELFNHPGSLRMNGPSLQVMITQNADPEQAAGVHYTFRPDWSLVSVGLTSMYERVHGGLEREGILSHPLDKRRETEELSRVRWLTPPDRLRAMMRR